MDEDTKEIIKIRETIEKSGVNRDELAVALANLIQHIRSGKKLEDLDLHTDDGVFDWLDSLVTMGEMLGARTWSKNM